MLAHLLQPPSLQSGLSMAATELTVEASGLFDVTAVQLVVAGIFGGPGDIRMRQSP